MVNKKLTTGRTMMVLAAGHTNDYNLLQCISQNTP